MTTLEKHESRQVKNSHFDDEFEKYLRNQCNSTTFNGSELENFSWYQKVLGLM